MLFRALPIAALCCLFVPPVHAQRLRDLTGVVLEAGTLTPVPGAVVIVGGVGEVARADSSGRFLIRRVPPGDRVAAFYGWGFEGQAFRVDLNEGGGTVDLGDVVLTPAVGSNVVFAGAVTDTAGVPVGGAVVNVNGRTVALSDPAGRFTASTGGSASNLIEIRRIGYEALAVPVTVPDTATVIPVDAVIRAIPYRLADIIVEGNRTTVIDRKLRDFYRRQRTGQGRFITRTDLERFPTHFVTDALRRVGVRVDHGGVGQPTILSIRRCVPQIVVDGFRLTGPFDLDDILIPDHVAGIEVHVGPATPVELMSESHACGVIAVWTR